MFIYKCFRMGFYSDIRIVDARAASTRHVSRVRVRFLCVSVRPHPPRDGARWARRRRARRCFFLFFFVAHSSRLAPSRDARRRCGDDIPKGISVVVPRACARRFRIVIRRLASRATALARAPRVRLRVRKPLSFVGSCLRSRRDARGDCDREGARERVDG